MFKFDFDIEDTADDTGKDETRAETKLASDGTEIDERPFVEHFLNEMLEKLPADISYSSVRVGDLCIPRRDLFDVRLQLMASEAQADGAMPHEGAEERENQAAIEFASRPSDLVPRVYEGGMKTWECSLDLADYVVGAQSGIEKFQGKRILELGCGTAIPTLAVLQKLLDQPIPMNDTPETVVHVQDYNTSVLEYVTLPNVILIWFFSKAGESYRSTLPPPSPKAPNKPLPDVSKLVLDSVPEEDEDNPLSNEATGLKAQLHAFDPADPGDLILSSALRAAFLDSLKDYRIQLQLFSGPWNKFNTRTVLPGGNSYDLVLTSETMYQPSSLPSLVRLLRDATATGEYALCLVAAKLVYFGVGGGIREFERALGVDGVRGKMKSVWEQREGVGRIILKIDFQH